MVHATIKSHVPYIMSRCRVQSSFRLCLRWRSFCSVGWQSQSGVTPPCRRANVPESTLISVIGQRFGPSVSRAVSQSSFSLDANWHTCDCVIWGIVPTRLKAGLRRVWKTRRIYVPRESVYTCYTKLSDLIHSIVCEGRGGEKKPGVHCNICLPDIDVDTIKGDKDGLDKLYDTNPTFYCKHLVDEDTVFWTNSG